jgi:poly-gamma-glutamate capsule biosynthesis protein CapA/YwtB (metallophosphatase superfamily)
MVQVTQQSTNSVVELARSGNLRAIACWLNTFLQPHNLFARVSASRSSSLQVLVEFYPQAKVDPRSTAFRSHVVRLVCNPLCKLQSRQLEGVEVVSRYIGQSNKILWRQSVRLISPARRAKGARSTPPMPASLSTPAPKPTPVAMVAKRPLPPQLSRTPQQLQAQIRQATRQKAQFKALRSFFLTGSTAAAFIIGCWMGYADAPAEQTSASAFSYPQLSLPNLPKTLETALGKLPVVQQPVADPTDPTATLMFGGDVALTEPYTEQVGQDHHWAFNELPEYRQADVAMVNLDAPFTRANTPLPGKTDAVKVDPDAVQVLKNGGVDLVNLANSRTLDYGREGLDETLTTLQQAGIHAIGAGKDAQTARRPEILEVKGQRIAYLGYDHLEAQIAQAGVAGTNFSRNAQVAADIKALRDQVDWVVVNYHWGDEIAKYPGDAQIDLARFTIDQGADLVVGYHSQMLQGAEIYKGRPIVYSLGNFIFGNKPASDYDTAVLKVGLKGKQMKVEMLPVEVRKYQPKVVSGDRGAQILKQIETVSDIFQQPMQPAIVLDTLTNTSETLATPVPSAAPERQPSPEATTNPALTPETPSVKPSVPAPSSDSPWNQDSFISKPTSNHSQIPATTTAPETATLSIEGTPATTPAPLPEAAAGSIADPSLPTAVTPPIPAIEADPMPPESSQPLSQDAEGTQTPTTPPPATAGPEATPQGANSTPEADHPTSEDDRPVAEGETSSTIPHPIQSLEPIKRRYAQLVE